ncbi:Uncharacterised protein [Yersinia pseudotuberculosis]|nr:Uncharacterised protein [Yersinia pseudotuberculosis]
MVATLHFSRPMLKLRGSEEPMLSSDAVEIWPSSTT